MHIKPKIIEWNADKAEKLLADRNIDINDIAKIIKSNKIITIEDVPNQSDHPGQRMYILNYKDYTFCVPFTYTKDGALFLKTVFPSRTYHKKFGENNG